MGVYTVEELVTLLTELGGDWHRGDFGMKLKSRFPERGWRKADYASGDRGSLATALDEAERRGLVHVTNPERQEDRRVQLTQGEGLPLARIWLVSVMASPRFGSVL